MKPKPKPAAKTRANERRGVFAIMRERASFVRSCPGRTDGTLFEVFELRFGPRGVGLEEMAVNTPL
jgi:hypothetical protein